MNAAGTEAAAMTFLRGVFAVVALITSVGLIVVVAYCAFTQRWIPAIFFLLARKELLSWLDSASGRMKDLPREDN